MDKIEQLITKFKKAREQISKNIIESYTAPANEVSMSEHACKGEDCNHDVHKGEAALKDKQMGVHVGSNPAVPGRSTMGILNSLNAVKEAKSEAKRVLKEMKKMPKLKLVKSDEEISFNEHGQWSLNKSKAIKLTPAPGADFSAPPVGANQDVAKHWHKLPKEVQHWFHAHHGQEKSKEDEVALPSRTKTVTLKDNKTS